MCVFRSGLAFGGVRVRCLCVRCVLCLVCLPLRVRPRVCPVPVLRFCEGQGPEHWGCFERRADRYASFAEADPGFRGFGG